jgi:nicotinamidase-related amidase
MFELSGASTPPSSFADAALVVINAQREYVDGALALPRAKPALSEIAKLIDRARKTGAPVLHVVQRSRTGMFAPGSAGTEIVNEALPEANEPVIEKQSPNAFSGTDLKAKLEELGRREIILAGFMTHMCVEATARAALDEGYKATVVASATATRDLPDAVTGAAVPAAEVQRYALAAIADQFAAVVADADAIPDDA